MFQPRIVVTIFGASLLAMAASAPASAQDNEARYAALLEQIANTKLAITQKEAVIANQKETIASLRKQIEEAPKLGKAVAPMLDKMVAAIETEIEQDLPFKVGERYARLDALKAMVSDPAARPGDKMRRALLVYDIEAGYGNSMEAYGGDHPVEPGARRGACEADANSSGCSLTKEMKEKMDAGATLRDLRDEIFDGSYLRYGRVALAYQNFDGSGTLRFDPESKEWVELNASQSIEVGRALRAARGEAAPTVVKAPVYVTN